MGISIDLEKVNYEKLIEELMKDKKINDRELLEKIILEFGNLVGEDLVLLHNEYYEDGICTWNLFNMIDEVFETEDTYSKYIKIREDMIDYKEIDEAYENLGLERKELEE
ncbi:MAG: hypothetical protein HFJ20_07110 [Clostridia bacterium]|nr:hypothetical protein [Clostridia bacterium]